MAQTKDFQIAFAQKVRAAAKALREAAAAAKDVKLEWESRGADNAARLAWLKAWLDTAEVPYTEAEFVAGATAVLDVAAFMDGGAVTTDDRATKLVKIRQD